MSATESVGGLGRGCEIDLWTGRVVDLETGQDVARLKDWQPLLASIATEMYLATPCKAKGLHRSESCKRKGLHLFDMTLLRSTWLEKAIRLQDVRSSFNVPRWKINEALNPYGWCVADGDSHVWQLAEGCAGDVQHNMRAAKTIDLLDTAESLLAHGQYQGALSRAVEALEHCCESQDARLVIGMCCMQEGIEASEEAIWDAADYLTAFERRLRQNIDGLSTLWRREQTSKPGARLGKWVYVPEYISRCENRLEELRDVFERAREQLRQTAS